MKKNLGVILGGVLGVAVVVSMIWLSLSRVYPHHKTDEEPAVATATGEETEEDAVPQNPVRKFIPSKTETETVVPKITETERTEILPQSELPPENKLPPNRAVADPETPVIEEKQEEVSAPPPAEIPAAAVSPPETPSVPLNNEPAKVQVNEAQANEPAKTQVNEPTKAQVDVKIEVVQKPVEHNAVQPLNDTMPVLFTLQVIPVPVYFYSYGPAPQTFAVNTFPVPVFYPQIQTNCFGRTQYVYPNGVVIRPK